MMPLEVIKRNVDFSVFTTKLLIIYIFHLEAHSFLLSIKSGKYLILSIYGKFLYAIPKDMELSS